MGCDIHIVLEKRYDVKGEKHWVGVRRYNYMNKSILGHEFDKDGWPMIGYRIKSRNYDFFNELCGVRGGSSSFGYTPRGLPDDASHLSHAELGDDIDLHSHSWLSMDELRPVLAKCFAPQLVKLRFNGEQADPLRVLIEDDIGDDGGNEAENWRLVFAFDN